MDYELWDQVTHNFVARFAREQGALASVRRTARVLGPTAHEVLNLVLSGPEGTIAAGQSLVDRAMLAQDARVHSEPATGHPDPWVDTNDAAQTVFCNECGRPVAVVSVRGPGRSLVVGRVRDYFDKQQMNQMAIRCGDHDN